jgi:hypothetical protein
MVGYGGICMDRMMVLHYCVTLHQTVVHVGGVLGRTRLHIHSPQCNAMIMM